MNSSQTTSRKEIRNRARKRRKSQKRIPQVIIAAGLLLIAASVYWVVSQRSTKATLDYDPEDIVNDQPLHAVHEMEPFNPASISFLPKDGPQPKIAVSESFFDFGSVGATEVVQHDFVIANQGDAPLTISRAYTTCGCTTADFTSSVIPPGKVVIMTLIFDAGFHDARGQTVRRGVIIENNDPNNSQAEIWTQAAVSDTP